MHGMHFFRIKYSDDYSVLEGAADIVADGVRQAAAMFGTHVLHRSEHGSFEAGEAHLQFAQMQHRARKGSLDRKSVV